MFETLKSDVSSRLYDATLPSESVAATVPTVTATVSITVDDVLPSAPRNVVLTPGNAQINVAWTAPEHNGGASIDAYRVRHRTTAAAASWNYSAPLTVSPYIIERLDNGTVYEVEVQARNSLQPPEFGHWSDVETTTPVAPTLPSVAAPGAPSKAGATSSSITVSWSAVTGAAKYQVRYKTGTNDWTTVEVAAATRYTAQMLDASTTYRFEVSAYGDGATRRAGWGAWSMHLDASSDAAPTMSGCTTTLGSISGTSTLQGTWTDECVSSNRRGTRYARYFTFELATAAELTIELVSEIDPYLYLMAGAGTSGTELAKNDDSRDFAFGYSDSRITYEAAAGTYTAEATTYPATSTGDFTIRIDALSEPTEPTIVQATPGDGEIVVTWNEPDRTGGAAITDYQVQYGTAASGQARSVTDPSINWRLAGWDSATSVRSKTITGLDNGTTYYVAVQARNDIDPADGDGALSEPITAVPAGQNTPPTFDQASYSLNVRRDAPSGHAVGSVAAIDTDVLTYRISGTTKFVVHSRTGQITTSGLLLTLTSASYDMTIYVSDGVNAEVSVPVTVTLDPSPIVLTISGLDGAAGTMAIGDDTEVTVEGSHLVSGVRYSLNVTTSDTSKLGFSSTCNRINAARELLSTSGTIDDAVLNLHACVAVHQSTVTATLNFSGTVIATANKTVNVRPAQPFNLRANGHIVDTAMPKVTLRWTTQADGYTYEARFALECWRNANPQVCTPSVSSWDVPTTIPATGLQGNSQVLTATVSVSLFGSLQRFQIRSKVGTVVSEWSDPVFVYPASSQPVYSTTPFGDRIKPTVGTIALTGYHPSHTYSYTICSNKFPSNTWVTEIQNAIDLIPGSVRWVEGGQNIILENEVAVSNQCVDLVTPPDPQDPQSMPVYAAKPYGEIRLADEDMFEYRRYCQETGATIDSYACAGPHYDNNDPLPRFLENHFILFRRDLTGTVIGSWSPGVNPTGANCSQFFQTALHEAAHAFGLSHAGENVSIMKPGRPRTDCVMRPYDVAAMMALYQSHVVE